jgi:hypothetical protein
MAGKGDLARPCDRRKYERGYDQIDWSKGKKLVKKKEDQNVSKIIIVAPLPRQAESYYCHLDMMGKGPSKSVSQMLQIPSSLLFNKN